MSEPQDRDDFELRVEEALARRAGDPDSHGLVAGARSRLRRRRTTRAALVGAGAVAVAVAIPLVVTGGASVDAPVAGPDVEGVEIIEIPTSWRFESYRDVEFAVPGEWVGGSLSTWCSGNETPEAAVPTVERPGMISIAIACQSDGYGVRVGGEVTNPPAGATVTETSVNGTLVTVVAPDPETARTVTGSVREIQDEDYYGCQSTREVPALGAMPAVGETETNESISLCRYEIGLEGPNLMSAEAITGEDNDRFRQALQDAEPGTGPDADPDECSTQILPPTEAVLIRSVSQDVGWVHYSGCDGHGLDLGGTTYRLDAEIMYGVLAQDFAIVGAVPMPDELRQR